MTKHLNKILAGLFLTLSVLLTSVVINYRQASIKYIHNTLPILLEEAVNENAKNKTADMPFSGLTHTPKKIGTVEERTFTTADTTFTYKYIIVDIETEIVRSQQSFLLLTESLHSNDVLLILDSLLNQRNINCPITIGITASFYKKINDWSPQNDTASTHFNFHSSLAEQGLFGDINYHAYINHSFKTLWKLMPQTLILSLLLLDLLVCCFFVVYTIKRKYQKQIETDVLPTIADELKLTGQLHNLFQMFIENHGVVNKGTIKKKFWPKNENPTTNMTTLVDRLKKKLSETESPYTIISDPEDEKHYRLTSADKTVIKSTDTK